MSDGEVLQFPVSLAFFVFMNLFQSNERVSLVPPLLKCNVILPPLPLTKSSMRFVDYHYLNEYEVMRLNERHTLSKLLE